MSSDRLERKRRSEIDISDDSADDQSPPVKIQKRESTSTSFVKKLTKTCSDFFKWIAPKFLKNLMIVDSQPSMGIADTTENNCIEDDDEVSVIAVQNGITGAQPQLYNAQRKAVAPINSIPANASICPLASTPNSFSSYSPSSSFKRTSRTMERRKTNGFLPRKIDKRKVENQKIVAPITNPSCDIEILLEKKLSNKNDVEIVDEVPPKKSPEASKRTKSFSASHSSRKEKVNYAEELITGTSSHSLPSRSSKFTAHEVIRLQERAQYQLLLDRCVKRLIYSPVNPLTNHEITQIDLTEDDDKPVLRYHFKKEKVEHVNNFLSKYYKPCALEPHTSNFATHNHRKKKDSENDIQICDTMPRLKPIISSVSSETIFTETWMNDLKNTIISETERRLQEIANEEGIYEFHKRRREAKIADELRKREEMRQAGVILPEDDEMEEDILPEITPEMESIIARALGAGPLSEILTSFDNLNLTRLDVSTLANLSWLNDQVINFYLALIVERSKQEGYPSVHMFNSFFYTSLKNRGATSVLLRWTRKIDIFSYDLIIVPLHLEMHWALLVVDNRSKTIKYYDSMGSGEERALYTVRNYLIAEMADKKKKAMDHDEYTLEIAREIPKQMNGSDCGMFTLKYAEYLSRDASLTFSQDNMPYFRRRMVYELLAKQIL